MVIVLLTEERPEPEMATRLALLVLDLPPWNSEEDLAEARRKWRQGWRCWSWICPHGIQRRIWPRQDGISSLCKSLKWFSFTIKPPKKISIVDVIFYFFVKTRSRRVPRGLVQFA